MKIWIVGLPNIGKSTLFNALTKSYAAQAGNFPFCTINPNVWIVDVKDPRIDKLSELSKSEKKVYANIEFVDIAGLVKWAGQWEWLWNKFLSHIKEVDAIVHILRYFDDNDVGHVEWNVDPFRDMDIINTELIFADLQQAEKLLSNVQKKAKSSKDTDTLAEYEGLKKIDLALKEWRMISEIKEGFSAKEYEMIRKYNFLTIKPMIYAVNVAQEDLSDLDNVRSKISGFLSSPFTVVCAKLEEEMMDFDENDRKEYLADLTSNSDVDHIPTLDDLIKLAFDTVGLMYYFTSGEKETKAWTVKKWSTAPQAAGAIHTDFERGFIKAEVVSYDDMVSCGSWSKAREKWLLRLEGKDYVVKDGDVMLFRFNV